MRRLESIEDDMKGIATYELSDGRRIAFDRHAIREMGLADCLRRAGLGNEVPTERLPVMLHGIRWGTMAPDFDPSNVRSNSFWYDPRPGDFKREGDTWVAARTLGPGDVESVVGFVSDTTINGGNQ